MGKRTFARTATGTELAAVNGQKRRRENITGDDFRIQYGTGRSRIASAASIAAFGRTRALGAGYSNLPVSAILTIAAGSTPVLKLEAPKVGHCLAFRAVKEDHCSLIDPQIAGT